MKETFAIPAVGAIIVKKVGDEEYILVQNRKKNNGDGMDGLKEIVDNSPESIFLMHVNALRKYLE